MTQEEKQILLKALCVMLPYGVHCCVFRLNENIKENDDILYGVIGDNVITLKCDEDECLMYYQIKPYLRPISSMTEDEQRTLDSMCNGVEMVSRLSGLKMFDKAFDWLNAHHFDYRGLIPMGLALEATKGMYRTE